MNIFGKFLINIYTYERFEGKNEYKFDAEGVDLVKRR